MARFKFRLATLLRLREATRDERRSELAEAFRADDLLEQQQGELGTELGELKSRYRAAAEPGTVHIDRLVEVQRYEVTLKAQQTQLAKQREVVAAEIERRRQVLIGADRDVRVLEKLREKQALRHRREEDRRENKRLDEVAGLCAVRESTAREEVR